MEQQGADRREPGIVNGSAILGSFFSVFVFVIAPGGGYVSKRSFHVIVLSSVIWAQKKQPSQAAVMSLMEEATVRSFPVCKDIKRGEVCITLQKERCTVFEI